MKINPKSKTWLAIFFCLIVIKNLPANEIIVLNVKGVIGPVISEYLITNIQKAERETAEMILIEIDTPGGLVSSTKDIVTQMLESKVPIVVYVTPTGAGAVSAGSFISLAAHLVAMAPGTNIGAAHPVALGLAADTSQVMSQKAANHLASYMKNITETRKRNGDLAAKMVTQSASFTEKEALKSNLINFISPDRDSLLAQLNGQTVKIDSGTVVLKTSAAKILEISLTWRQQFLHTLSNPSIAYIFIILGLLGIYFELANPGVILPGFVGVFCLVVGFFATEVLSINWAGFLLILLAFILFLLEVKIASFGLLTVGGVIAMFVGSLMLFKAPIPILKISWSVVIAATATTALFFLFALGKAFRAQRQPVTTGKEGLIGQKGIAISDLGPEVEGSIKVAGEIWNAFSRTPVAKGERVVIKKIDSLLLEVEKNQE